MDQDREERIRARAYEIWEREGRQEGSHEAHWQQAENELREEDGGEQEPGGDDPATRTDAASGLASDLQPSGSATSGEPGASGKSAETGGGSTADAPSGTSPRKKS